MLNTDQIPSDDLTPNAASHLILPTHSRSNTLDLIHNLPYPTHHASSYTLSHTSVGTLTHSQQRLVHLQLLFASHNIAFTILFRLSGR